MMRIHVEEFKDPVGDTLYTIGVPLLIIFLSNENAYDYVHAKYTYENLL